MLKHISHIHANPYNIFNISTTAEHSLLIYTYICMCVCVRCKLVFEYVFGESASQRSIIKQTKRGEANWQQNPKTWYASFCVYYSISKSRIGQQESKILECCVCKEESAEEGHLLSHTRRCMYCVYACWEDEVRGWADPAQRSVGVVCCCWIDDDDLPQGMNVDIFIYILYWFRFSLYTCFFLRWLDIIGSALSSATVVSRGRRRRLAHTYNPTNPYSEPCVRRASQIYVYILRPICLYKPPKSIAAW